jgi:RNA polymerase sigma-70 factor (ECF subfamily)
MTSAFDLVITVEEPAREAQFAALVARRSLFVYRVAYAVLRNVFDAEDVVQDTFLKLYRTHAWAGMKDEKAFLARTAWRIAVDRRRKRQHGALDAEMRSNAANPEEAAIQGDWSAMVQRLVDALPEELRLPLALAGVEELSSREIAGVMGIAEGTVRTRIMRGRQMVKEKLAALLEKRNAR